MAMLLGNWGNGHEIKVAMRMGQNGPEEKWAMENGQNGHKDGQNGKKKKVGEEPFPRLTESVVPATQTSGTRNLGWSVSKQ